MTTAHPEPTRAAIIGAAGIAAAKAVVDSDPEPGELVVLLNTARGGHGRQPATVVGPCPNGFRLELKGGRRVTVGRDELDRYDARMAASAAARAAKVAELDAPPVVEEPAGPLVVIPCGGAKATVPSFAGELYVGSYHRAARAAAERVGARRILILSALHGLLELDTFVEPYELRMGAPGSVDAATVRRQALELGEADAGDVVLLLPASYAAAAADAWPAATSVLAGEPGIGYQLRALRHLGAVAA